MRANGPRLVESTPSGHTERLRIAYISAADWESIKQRPQHLARELSHQHDVLYVRPRPLSRALQYTARRLRAFQTERVGNSLVLLSPPALSPGRIRAVARVNDEIASREIRRACPTGRPDVLWLSHPAHAAFAGTLGERLVAYDLMDNHVAFAAPGRRAAVDAQEVKILRMADVVFVSSEGLRRRAMRHARGAVQLVQNAVDWGHFVRAAIEALPRPADLPGVSRFSVGFYGTLGPWVDTHLVRSIAEAHPDWTLVLFGPAQGADLGNLGGLANVHVTGPKPYGELPGYLQHIDVWTLPFRASPLTADVDPVKVYEYLAAGKPVVAIDIPELAKFSDLIRVAVDAAGFLAALETARDEVCSDRHNGLVIRRIGYVREHTWAQRAAIVSQALKQALALRASHPCA